MSIPQAFYLSKDPTQSTSGAAGGSQGWLARILHLCIGSIAQLCNLEGQVLGSAFLVSNTGLLATNLSKIKDCGSHSLKACFLNETFFSCRMVAYDPACDLAFVKIDGDFSGASLRPLTVVRSSSGSSLNVAALAFMPEENSATNGAEGAKGAKGGESLIAVPAVFPGCLRAIKVAKKIELVCRMHSDFPPLGSPLFNQNGRVLGLICKGEAGLNKATGAEHLHALMRLYRLEDLPQGEILRVVSCVGDRKVGFRRERSELPMTMLADDIQEVQQSFEKRKDCRRLLFVHAQKAALI